MKTYKCDRCNKVLDHHERNIVKTKEWDNTIGKIDLCNECFTAFEKFIYYTKE